MISELRKNVFAVFNLTKEKRGSSSYFQRYSGPSVANGGYIQEYHDHDGEKDVGKSLAC